MRPGPIRPGDYIAAVGGAAPGRASMRPGPIRPGDWRHIAASFLNLFMLQ